MTRVVPSTVPSPYHRARWPPQKQCDRAQCHAAAKNPGPMASQESELKMLTFLQRLERERQMPGLELSEFLLFRLNTWLKSVVFIVECSWWSQEQRLLGKKTIKVSA